MVQLLFSFRGRIARLTYLVMSTIIWGAIGVTGQLADMVTREHLPTNHVQTISAQTVVELNELTGPEAVVALLAILMAVTILFVWLAVTTKRLHDVGLTGWLSVPLAMAGPLTIFLSIFPGTPGDNHYGCAPGDDLGDIGAELDRVKNTVQA